MNHYKYTDSNKRYYTLDYFYKQKFHQKVAKISLNAGFTCPNRDGTKGVGGCIYCSKSGSGDFAGDKNEDIVTQFNNIRLMMDRKWKDTLYIGYFQANTNTYAEIDLLKQKYEPILDLDKVVGLSIATRPDAITNECLNYLEELNKRTFLTVELGLQTIHEETSNFINRGHNLECFDQMVAKLRKRNISVVVHIINGLPHESKEMMLDTIRHINKLDIQGIKIHMLHIIENTLLAKIYKENPFEVLTKEKYVEIVCDQLELLRDDIVIHRITGDPNQSDLVEPDWLIKKIDVLNSIDKELKRRRTYQGFKNSIINRLEERIDYYLKPNSLAIDATIDERNNSKYMNSIIKTGKVFDFSKDNNHQISNMLDNHLGKISLIVFYLKDTSNEELLNYIRENLKMIHSHGVILITINNDEENQINVDLLKNSLKENKVFFYYDDKNTNHQFLLEIQKKS